MAILQLTKFRRDILNCSGDVAFQRKFLKHFHRSTTRTLHSVLPEHRRCMTGSTFCEQPRYRGSCFNESSRASGCRHRPSSDIRPNTARFMTITWVAEHRGSNVSDWQYSTVWPVYVHVTRPKCTACLRIRWSYVTVIYGHDTTFIL